MNMSKVFSILKKEKYRQANTIELIASENFVSDNILKALGSEFTNKYTEGYPQSRWHDIGQSGRYYGGCQYYDELEEYCCAKWREVFNTNYHVNVQLHSGSQANMAAYRAVLKPHDKVLALKLSDGGHLTHGSKVSFSGQDYDFYYYGLTAEGFIDYDDLKEKIKTIEPKAVMVGASAYSREIDYNRIAKIIKECSYTEVFQHPHSKEEYEHTYKPIYIVDMAHVAGLIAADLLQSPFGYADIITTTTQKTLRGPRGGLIFCRPELAKQIDKAVFPGVQGGSLMNVIAAKAICAEEALTPEYKEYAKQVIKNSKAMAKRFQELGYHVVTNGTDNHMFLLDLRNKGISGKTAQNLLDEYGITVNKNTIPNDSAKPGNPSGIRIGTAAMTTKGYTEQDFVKIANEINNIFTDFLIGQLE